MYGPGNLMLSVGQAPVAPAFPGGAFPPAGVPGIAVPPGQVASQVWAGPPACDVQQIPVSMAPACPDPNRSLQLNKRVFTTVVSGLFVADDGENLIAGFSLTTPGLVAQAPEPNSFVVRTDAQTRGTIRDITISYDAFSLDYLAFGITIPEVLNSYAQSYTALLAGRITVDNIPFATIIPIASAIKIVSGIRAYWTVSPVTTAGQSVLYVSHDNESTHTALPAPIQIPLQPSSEFGVFLTITSRDVLGGAAAGYQAIIGGQVVAASFVWTGLITVLVELNTSLGAFGIGQ